MKNLTLSPVKVGACCLLILFSLFFASEGKRSACWRYGHSCYGGHGKRSQPQSQPEREGGLAGHGTRSGGPGVPIPIPDRMGLSHLDTLLYKLRPPPPLPLFRIHQIQRRNDGETQPQQDPGADTSENASLYGSAGAGADSSIFVRSRKLMGESDDTMDSGNEETVEAADISDNSNRFLVNDKANMKQKFRLWYQNPDLRRM